MNIVIWQKKIADTWHISPKKNNQLFIVQFYLLTFTVKLRMIVHPQKLKEPQFEDYIIGTPALLLKPEMDLYAPKHKCDKCNSTFEYEN